MADQASMEEKRRYWREHVRTWKESGLGVTAYARKQGINLKTFHYWRQVLRREENAKPAVFQRIEVEPLESKAASFRMDGEGEPGVWSARLGDCRLRLPNGVILELTGVVDAEGVGRLLLMAGSLPGVDRRAS